MILLFSVFLFIKAETEAEVQEIVLGSWHVTANYLPNHHELPETRHFHFKSTPTHQTTIVSGALYDSPDLTANPIRNYTLFFSQTSKGKFSISENIGKSVIPIASFDFSPLLHPHISSVGDWGTNKSFNSIFISNKIAQLTIFEKNSDNWTVYTFDKENEFQSNSFLDRYYQYFLMAFAFFLAYLVSKKVQQWQIEKKEKEVEAILLAKQKQKKKEKKKKKQK